MKNFYILSIIFISTITVSATTIVKHTIKKGETLYSIAQKNHTTVKEIRRINGIKRGEPLKLGKVLTIRMNTFSQNKAKKVAKVTKKRKYKRKLRRKKQKPLYAILNRESKLYERTSRSRLIIDDMSFKSSQPNFFMFKGFGSQKARNIIRVAKTKLGRKYVWGAVGQKGTFDCSGFTNYVYKKNGIYIPRTSLNQSKYGQYVSRNNLRQGDLIFFDTSKRKKGYVNHVGIYIGNGKFIHASSAMKKVVITSLNEKFYSKRYKGARRPS